MSEVLAIKLHCTVGASNYETMAIIDSPVSLTQQGKSVDKLFICEFCFSRNYTLTRDARFFCSFGALSQWTLCNGSFALRNVLRIEFLNDVEKGAQSPLDFAYSPHNDVKVGFVPVRDLSPEARPEVLLRLDDGSGVDNNAHLGLDEVDWLSRVPVEFVTYCGVTAQRFAGPSLYALADGVLEGARF